MEDAKIGEYLIAFVIAMGVIYLGTMFFESLPELTELVRAAVCN